MTVVNVLNTIISIVVYVNETKTLLLETMLIAKPPIFESVLILVIGFREVYAILIQILLILTMTRVTSAIRNLIGN